jgi:hypothetical protein
MIEKEQSEAPYQGVKVFKPQEPGHFPQGEVCYMPNM